MSNKLKDEKFKALLEESYDWPTFYVYKFIVPTSELDHLKSLLAHYDGELSERPSRKGNYTSVGLKLKRRGPDDVMVVYEKVSVVQGIVSL